MSSRLRCRIIPIFVFVAIGARLMAQTPSPALLITIRGKGNRSLQIADPMSMKVVGTIPLGATRPHEIAVAPDGTLAYVAISDMGLEQKPGVSQYITEDYISVIDLSALKEIDRIVIGSGGWPFSLLMIRGKLYYTAEGYGLIGRYDPTRREIDRMVGTGQIRSHSFAISRDGEHIFTANGFSNSVTSIGFWDVPADSKMPGAPVSDSTPLPHWMTTLIPVGKEPEGIAISPDDKEVWVVNRGDGTLSVIEVASNKVSQTVDLKVKEPFRIAFTPNGERAIIAAHIGTEVVVQDVASRKELKRINVGKEAHGVLISPDGLHAYVNVIGGSSVEVIDLKTLEVIGRIATLPEPEAMAWAERPNGIRK